MKVNTITNHHEVSFCRRHDALFLPFLLFTLTSLTMISGLVLASSIVSADDNSTVDQISITVPMSCTMSGTGMDSHNTNINNGTYTPNIGTTTMHVFCNDNAGFAIYAAGYTGDEIGGENSNKLVGTNASGNSTIESGLATSAGSPDISNWAMKLSLTQDSGDTTDANAFMIDSAPNVDFPSQAEQSATPVSFSEYHVVPNEYVKVVHKNSGTDMTNTTGGVKLTATYAAYISKTQPADTYTGQVIYTLVHPSTEVPKVSVKCNPTGTTIGTNSNTDIVCMQDFASLSSSAKSTIISNMAEGTQYTLTDKRDEKTYTISKLKDGKVWMTQNLDLDLDSSTTYTNEDTDLGWNTQTNVYQTASWTPSRSTYATTTNNIHEWCQGGTWNSQYGYCENNTPESYDPGDLYWNTTTSDFSDWNAYYDSCDFSTSTPSCNESLNPLSTYVSSTGTEQYHLGNYYNWPAAIASNDAGVYGAYNETTGDYENLETHQSICPAGWTLPYSTWNDGLSQYEGDFADLWSEYGWTDNGGFSDISTIWSAPLYFAPAGDFGGNLGGVGGYGLFWSSVADYGSDALGAYFGLDGGATPASDVSRDFGYSVRCLLRQPSISFDDVYAANNKTQINNHYAIQDLDDSMCSSVSIGQIATVIDVRDYNTYMIRKMKDGNCWMLENLRLDPTNSITASSMSTNNTNASAAAITNYLNGGNSGHIDGWSSVAVANSYGVGIGSNTEPRINNEFTNTLVTAYGPAAVNEQAKTGVFYNYCAASVGTYCYEYGEDQTQTDILYDVCPINWRMPVGARIEENNNWHGGFYDLYKEYDSSLAYSDPKGFSYNLSLPLSGFYSNGTVVDQNMKNAFWTRTSWRDGATIFGFDIDDDVNDEYAWWIGSNRDHYNSIRCLLMHD